jgi:hypothetical protein
MDFFVDILILPILSYFQLLYDYFLLIKIISPYSIYDYLWLFLNFFVIFSYCKLFQFKLLVTIISYFWLLKVISPYVIIGYYRLFHLKLFLSIINYFTL